MFSRALAYVVVAAWFTLPKESSRKIIARHVDANVAPAHERDDRESRLIYFNRVVRKITSALGKSPIDTISSETMVPNPSERALQNEFRYHSLGSSKSYTVTRLIYPSDGLPLLFGITQHLQHNGWGEYFRGFWSTDMARQLTWETNFSQASTAYRGYTAPLWSFLYPHGAAQYYYWDFVDQIQHTEIPKAKCVLQGLDKMGAITDG